MNNENSCYWLQNISHYSCVFDLSQVVSGQSPPLFLKSRILTCQSLNKTLFISFIYVR